MFCALQVLDLVCFPKWDKRSGLDCCFHCIHRRSHPGILFQFQHLDPLTAMEHPGWCIPGGPLHSPSPIVACTITSGLHAGYTICCLLSYKSSLAFSLTILISLADLYCHNITLQNNCFLSTLFYSFVIALFTLIELPIVRSYSVTFISLVAIFNFHIISYLAVFLKTIYTSGLFNFNRPLSPSKACFVHNQFGVATEGYTVCCHPKSSLAFPPPPFPTIFITSLHQPISIVTTSHLKTNALFIC